MNEFFRLTVFDWFSGQSDRGDANLIFKISSDTRLAPIFDNGASMSYHKKIKENILILLSSYFSSFDNLRFPVDNIYLNEYNFYLFKLITDNNEFFKYFSLALDIDITYFINETIKKYHLIIPSEDKKEIIEFFDYKKQIIENTLKLSIKYK